MFPLSDSISSTPSSRLPWHGSIRLLFARAARALRTVAVAGGAIAAGGAGELAAATYELVLDYHGTPLTRGTFEVPDSRVGPANANGFIRFSEFTRFDVTVHESRYDLPGDIIAYPDDGLRLDASGQPLLFRNIGWSDAYISDDDRRAPVGAYNYLGFIDGSYPTWVMFDYFPGWGQGQWGGTYQIKSLPSPKAYSLLGSWRGTYTCSGVTSGIDISFYRKAPSVWIPPSDTDPFWAPLTLYPGAQKPGPVGTLSMAVEQKDAYSFSLKRDRWISPPVSTPLLSLDGKANPNFTVITGKALGNGCSTFRLTRLAPDAPPLPTCATIRNQIDFMQDQLELGIAEQTLFKNQISKLNGDPVQCTKEVMGALVSALAHNKTMSILNEILPTSVINFLRKGSSAKSLAEREALIEDAAGVATIFSSKDEASEAFNSFKKCKIAATLKVKNQLIAQLREIYGQAGAWKLAIEEARGKHERICAGPSS